MRIRLLRAVGVLTTSLAALASLAAADSAARNPLTRLGLVRHAIVHKPHRRVTALSTFDLSFDLENRHLRLALEPNHDLIPDGAAVRHLRPDGTLDRVEPLHRHDHKVFKGRVKVETVAGEWRDVGWARITVTRDGETPTFQGTFSVFGDSHHIKSAARYMETKQELDPVVDVADEDTMVVFRDSDTADEAQRMELRRRRGVADAADPEPETCESEQLLFNGNPAHPVYRRQSVPRDDGFWAGSSFASLFARQLDSSPGSGNSGLVNLVAHIGSPVGCPTTRKVALVGVATDCTYRSSFASEEKMRSSIIDTMNSASAVFEDTFSISLAMANLTVTDAECPGEEPSAATPWNVDCSDDVTIQDRLNLFSAWRGSQQDRNSHWTLLTECKTGSAVGLAWLGQACVRDSHTTNFQGGGSETVAGANVVAKTLTEWQVVAHETGHTFGAVHDCTADTCANAQLVQSQQCCPLSADTCDAGEQYIMNPATASGITQFSPCSIGNVCSALGSGSVKSSCLSDNRGVTTVTGQVCGNGIVEDGEECDCGGDAGCGDNACCDPKSCTFKPGAVCDDANEDCCDACQFASANAVCRPSAGSCDPEERCTGASALCPNDVTRPDGEDCADGLQCASGQCTSRDLQCKTVMGSYTHGNDTYACDSQTCTLSCASPEFGPGVCYGLQQNFLDGTACAGGGACDNGQCLGASLANEVGSWISDHQPLVIGLGSSAGALASLSALACAVRCCLRRKRRKRVAAAVPRHPHSSHHHRSHVPPLARPRNRRHSGRSSSAAAGWPRSGADPAGQQPLMMQHGPSSSSASGGAWRPPLLGTQQGSYQVSSASQLWGQGTPTSGHRGGGGGGGGAGNEWGYPSPEPYGQPSPNPAGVPPAYVRGQSVRYA